MPSVSLFQPTVVRKGKSGKTKVWWMKWTDIGGEVQRVSTKARDKSVAKQIARETERRLSLDPYGLAPNPFSNMSWDKAAAEYLNHMSKTREPGTALAYGFSLTHFKQLMKPSHLRDVTVAKLQTFTHLRSEKVGNVTINKDLRAVRAFLRWCVEQTYLPVTPKFKTAFLKEEFKLPVKISLEDRQKLLAALDAVVLVQRSAEWWRVFIQILNDTGCRPGEALNLKWEAVDLDNMEVIYRKTKGHRERALPIDENLAAMLRAWKPAGAKPSMVVLPQIKTTRRQLYDEWEKIRSAAGVKFVLKNFRSTCGSELIEKNVPTVVVRDFLGHSTVVTTEKAYINTSGTLRSAAAKRTALAPKASETP